MKTFWITTLMLGIFWTPSRKEKGMVQVKENLLYDVGEISNIQWKEFESTLVARGENIEAYRQNEVWTDAIYRDSYFSHPAFANYPVVGITQKGARAFCAWRNQMDQGTPGTFRLPTQAEFQYVLEKGEQSDKWQKKKARFIRRNGYVYNFWKERARMALPSESLLENELGIYHLKGNAAELVEDGTLVVGGSWEDAPQEDWKTYTNTYKGPHASVGFRCVCELDGE
ncbi:MAG: SUMF1/EgtB/PvdO family nonheme iron enzyme [Bacteroidota bacterium]